MEINLDPFRMFIFEIVYSDQIQKCIIFVSVACNICQQKIEMVSLKYKGFLRTKLKSELQIVVSSLRKENAYLKKTLVELSRQHSEHYKLVEVNFSVNQCCFPGIYQHKSTNQGYLHCTINST